MKHWKQEKHVKVWQQPAVQVGAVCWTTNTKRVKECEVIDKEGYEIHIPVDIHTKIEVLSEEVGNLEWLGYLLGQAPVEGKVFHIEGIEVPEQEVTAGSVDVTKPLNRPDVLGTVHLHPMGGGAFLSTTDDTFVGGNHPVTISFNHAGVYKAVVKKMLPCQASVLIEAKVVVDKPLPADLTEFVIGATDKIKQRVVYVGQGWDGQGYEPGMTCSVCHNKFSYQELTWEQGLARCPECHANYVRLNNGDKGYQQKFGGAREYNE